MATIIDEEIRDFNTPWEGYVGTRVQAFIKKHLEKHENAKVGIIKVRMNESGDNVILQFIDEETYNEWNDLPDAEKWSEEGMKLVLASEVLPTDKTDTYSTMIDVEEIPEPIQNDTNVTINVRGTSTVTYFAGGTENISEDLIIQIQTRTSTTASWSQRAEIVVAANNPVYTPISLKPYLYNGANYVRVRAMGGYASSIWKSFTINVVALQLVPKTSFEVAMTGSELAITYLVGGSIAKTIQFQLGEGRGDSFVPVYTYLNNDEGCSRNLGTQTNLSTGISFNFTNAKINEHMMADGVHTVRARLYVSDTVKTDWVESQYMVVRDVTDQPLVVVNKVQPTLNNWTEARFFDWAIYTGGEGTKAVYFKLKDWENVDTLATWSFLAQDNVNYEFISQLGVELTDTSITEFYGYMHIEDENGVELAPPVFFTIYNSAAYTPTGGADFVVVPSSRSNTEAVPRTIINTVTNTIVPSTWTGFGLSADGWIDVNKDVDDMSVNADKVRALRIPAGRRLDIEYNPFSDFMRGNSTGRHVTIELDLRTNNILDENEPIFKICSEHPTDHNAHGFEMLPLEMYLLTANKRDRENQNASWAEGERTRLTVNVVYGLNGLNYVRMFVNGVMDREFTYAIDDNFVSENVHMVIGNTSSDIDIFGMRIYKKALSTSEVMQDYKATLGTIAEKLAFADANDITGDDDAISFTKALEKYNVIGLTGHLAKYGDENKGKTKGNTLLIHIQNDPAHSGVITNLENAGQGTTAMTYYDWNQQQKITDTSVFTNENGEVSEAGKGYAIMDGEAKAKKLCGKINFASSMQSHKLGLCWIFNDVFKELIERGAMSEPTQVTLQKSARIAVYEKPFLFFHRETEDDPWTFKYLMTWGAGKGDKPSFGFDKKTTPDLLMVDGANNDRPLAVFRIPWNDDIVYSADDEAWMYNGQKQMNFNLGTTDENEVPNSVNGINCLKRFFNFVYLHHSGIKYFNGTLSQLRLSEDVNTSYLYWVTNADDTLGTPQYNLYRYDEITKQWVDGGIEKLGRGQYETLNMREQYEAFGGTAAWSAGQWDAINELIKTQRRIHFKDNAHTVMHVDDALYHSCFVKLFAGTDNRAKNTYYYSDPGTLKVRWMQDDLDTTIKTNNVGQNRKPYYVEEHDKNAAGEYYWQGEDSGFYNLLEEAFYTEMKTMMYNVFSAMASLGGTVMGFLHQYLLYTQDYFPAIAYNEQARLVYEVAAVAQAAGIYKNDSVQAITQSCGSQRWSEYEWLKNRVMYISSWCEYGEFAGSSSASGGLSWRCAAGAYNFSLTPARWMYVRVGSDSGNYPASLDGSDVRVRAGETYAYPTITINNDSLMSIRGIEYMYDIGEMNMPLSSSQGTFSFSGKRLQRITINADGTQENYFRATEIQINNAINIKEFIVQGVNTMTNALDLSKCTRLEKIIITGTTTPNIKLPASETLKELRLPATLLSLSVTANPNLETVTFEGAQYLRDVTINQAMAGALNSFSIASMMYQAGVTPTHISFTNLSWVNTDIDVLMWLCDNNAELTGTIRTLVSSFRRLSFDEKMTLAGKYGNIDSNANKLYITYEQVSITQFGINGELYIWTLGEHTYYASITSGNNIKLKNDGTPDITFSFDPDASAYASMAEDGTLTLIQVIEGGKFNITCTLALLDGSLLQKGKSIGLWHRAPVVGDFAYVDGTFADVWDPSKTCVGLVYMIQKNSDVEFLVFVVSVKRDIVLMSSDAQWTTAIFSFGIDSATFAASPYNDAIVAATGLPSAYYISGNPSNAYGTRIWRIQDNIYDANTEDGFAAVSYPPATIMNGKERTKATIVHSDTILTKYLGLAHIPETLQELADTEQQVITANNSNYRQFFFEAFRVCNLYEPDVMEGEIIADAYKKGEWYLPAPGQAVRICAYWLLGTATSQANENAASIARTPIFANANKRAAKTLFQFYNPTGTTAFATAVAYNATNSWVIGPENSNGVKSLSSRGLYNAETRRSPNYIRACAEFIFRLDED